MDYNQHIWDLLHIKRRNWVWLAYKLGISKARLSQFKNGEYPMKYRARICLALEVPYYMIWGID